MKWLKLGFIYDDNHDLINHRTMFKILVNPFLRHYFNRSIGTEVLNDKLMYQYRLIYSPPSGRTLLEQLKASWIYK